MRHDDELETDAPYFKIICEPTDEEGTHTMKQKGKNKGKVITMTRSKAQIKTNTKSRPKSTTGREIPKSSKKSTNGRKPVPTQKKRSNRAGGIRTAQILELLNKPGGATLKDIMNATGWQAHSVRGFLSGVVGKKLGLGLTSERHDGTRVYSL